MIRRVPARRRAVLRTVGAVAVSGVAGCLGRDDEQPTTGSVPSSTTCVVVRGHGQTHGYGEQAMTAAIDSEVTRRVQQGSTRQPIREC